METLRHLDDRLLTDVNDFARPAGRLHPAILGYATDGIVVARRLGLIAATAALVMAFVMAFARVYVTAHDPRDAVAGPTVGAGVALAGWWLIAGPLTMVTERLRRQPGRRRASPQPTPHLPASSGRSSDGPGR
ncbi:MAG: UDP-diphosphatase [Modestobacter sp.]|nr:UDP-diphosphatase [Modestobacter sp.]